MTTDRRRIYVVFPHWTEFAKNPLYLQYAIDRIITAGWCPVVPSVYLLPTPPYDTVVGDIIGNTLARVDAMIVCYEGHMTAYMTNEIVAAKKLQLRVISFNISEERLKELADGYDGRDEQTR